MRKFHVLFNMARPDGQWYFEHDTQAPTNDDEDDEEDDVDEGGWGSGDGNDNNISSNELRTYPNTERIMPLLKAMVLAATKMPDLQDIGIKTNIPTGGQSPPPVFEIVYVTAGNSNSLDRFKGWGPSNDEGPGSGRRLSKKLGDLKAM